MKFREPFKNSSFLKPSRLASISILTVLALVLSLSQGLSSYAQDADNNGSSTVQSSPTKVEREDVTGPAVPGQFVVKFRQTFSESSRADAVEALGGYIFDRIPDLDVEAVEFPSLAKANATADSADALAIMNALK